jgi:hypothetical protein
MTLDEALAIFKRDEVQVDEKGLYDLGFYIAYTFGEDTAVLDAHFTADQLEAIAVYMRWSQQEVKK